MPTLTSSSRSTIAYSVSYATTQKLFARKSHQPITGTCPWMAANAIGMPKENATPRYSCGTGKKRLNSGYVAAIATAATASRIAASFRKSSSSADSPASSVANATASRGLTSPCATTRPAVRFTCAS